MEGIDLMVRISSGVLVRGERREVGEKVYGWRLKPEHSPRQGLTNHCTIPTKNLRIERELKSVVCA